MTLNIHWRFSYIGILTKIELLIQNEAFDWKLSNFFTTFSKMAKKVMFYFFANCLGTAWNPY